MRWGGGIAGIVLRPGHAFAMQTKSARTGKSEAAVPILRCGDWMGRASAGLIILGTVSFALAAAMADFL
jgi:hypothetical protein